MCVLLIKFVCLIKQTQTSQLGAGHLLRGEGAGDRRDGWKQKGRVSEGEIDGWVVRGCKKKWSETQPDEER